MAETQICTHFRCLNLPQSQLISYQCSHIKRSKWHLKEVDLVTFICPEKTDTCSVFLFPSLPCIVLKLSTFPTIQQSIKESYNPSQWIAAPFWLVCASKGECKTLCSPQLPVLSSQRLWALPVAVSSRAHQLQQLSAANRATRQSKTPASVPLLQSFSLIGCIENYILNLGKFSKGQKHHSYG